jgi:hypothetical protein
VLPLEPRRYVVRIIDVVPIRAAGSIASELHPAVVHRAFCKSMWVGVVER